MFCSELKSKVLKLCPLSRVYLYFLASSILSPRSFSEFLLESSSKFDMIPYPSVIGYGIPYASTFQLEPPRDYKLNSKNGRQSFFYRTSLTLSSSNAQFILRFFVTCFFLNVIFEFCNHAFTIRSTDCF